MHLRVDRSQPSWPVASTKAQAASTLGPMEPGGKLELAELAGEVAPEYAGRRRAEIGFDRGNVGEEKSASASSNSASSAAVRSLSMTASTPRTWPSLVSDDGNAASAATDHTDAVRRAESLDDRELDDLARQRRGDYSAPEDPSCRTSQSRSFASRSASVFFVDLADELRRMCERGIIGSDDGLADERGERLGRDGVVAVLVRASSRSCPGSGRREHRGDRHV